MALSALEMVETPNETEPVHAFEFQFVLAFIRQSTITTFPDYRQKFMKSIIKFFSRLRTVYNKQMKNVTSPDDVGPCAPLVSFLADVIECCELNLYQDKPIEGCFPLFDILKSI